MSEKRLEYQLQVYERVIEHLLDIIDDLLEKYEKGNAVRAILRLNNMNNATKATFTEFDKDGKPVKRSGPITFASDNTAVATVDNSLQVENADFSTTCPVATVAGASGTANITAVDAASQNKVAAGAEDVVTVPVPVAVSATLVLE